MTIIEGIGDDVLAVFGALLATGLVALAWVSTNVTHRPLISVLILDRTTFERLLQRLRNAGYHIRRSFRNGRDTPENEETNEDNTTSDEAESDDATQSENTAPDDESTEPSATAQAEVPAPTLCDNDDVTELRKRRINFLGGKTDASVAEESPSPTAAPSPADDVTEPEVPEGHITVRLKYFDDRQRLVQARPDESVQQFKQRHFAGELSEQLGVRLILNGQELSDGATLQNYNIHDNCTIHCLVHARQGDPTAPPGAAGSGIRQADLDVGRLMFPLFALMLLLIWYCRITYRQYFNAMSTFALVSISLLFAISSLAAWRRGQEAPPHHHND